VIPPGRLGTRPARPPGCRTKDSGQGSTVLALVGPLRRLRRFAALGRRHLTWLFALRSARRQVGPKENGGVLSNKGRHGEAHAPAAGPNRVAGVEQTSAVRAGCRPPTQAVGDGAQGAAVLWPLWPQRGIRRRLSASCWVARRAQHIERVLEPLIAKGKNGHDDAGVGRSACGSPGHPESCARLDNLSGAEVPNLAGSTARMIPFRARALDSHDHPPTRRAARIAASGSSSSSGMSWAPRRPPCCACFQLLLNQPDADGQRADLGRSSSSPLPLRRNGFCFRMRRPQEPPAKGPKRCALTKTARWWSHASGPPSPGSVPVRPIEKPSAAKSSASSEHPEV